MGARASQQVMRELVQDAQHAQRTLSAGANTERLRKRPQRRRVIIAAPQLDLGHCRLSEPSAVSELNLSESGARAKLFES